MCEMAGLKEKVYLEKKILQNHNEPTMYYHSASAMISVANLFHLYPSLSTHH